MTTSILHRSFVSLPVLALVVACGGGAEDPVDGDESSSGGSTTASSTSATTTASTTASSTTASSTTMGSASDTDAEGSSSDSADGSSSAADGTSTTGDAVVPTVVETIPADSAVGVRDDVALVIRFSTAMDQAATQAAYQSASIPAALVTFAWNDAGDELTVTPNAPLAYASGSDPGVAALAYDFTITTAARSLDDAMLAADVEVGFTTLRHIDQVLEHDAELSGNVGATSGALGSTMLGDRNTDEAVRWGVTFDLAELAPDVAEVESAELRASWNQQSGNPWAGLGGGTVYQQVQFASLDEAFDAPGLGMGSGLFGSVADVDVMRDAAEPLAAVLDDLDGFGGLLQLRLRWLLDSDDDGAYDSVTIVADDLELHVSYLAP